MNILYPESLHLPEKHLPEKHLPEKHFPECILEQCSHLADFFQPVSDLLEQGQMIFGNMVNIASENSTN